MNMFREITDACLSGALHHHLNIWQNRSTGNTTGTLFLWSVTYARHTSQVKLIVYAMLMYYNQCYGGILL